MNSKIKPIVSYSVASAFQKSVGLVLLPAYIYSLSVEQFGELDLIFVLLTFFQYALGFGWSSAYLRFRLDKNFSSKDFKTTMFLSRIGLGLILLLLLNCLPTTELLRKILNVDFDIALWTGVVIIYISRDIFLFWETEFRACDNHDYFLKSNIFAAMSQMVSVLICLFVFKLGIHGIVWGQAVSLCAVTSLLCFLNKETFLDGKYRINYHLRSLQFGFPLQIATIFIFMILVTDRVMMSQLMSEENALYHIGNYGLANRIIGILAIILSGFSLFWAPYVYKTNESQSEVLNYNGIFELLVLSLFVFGIVICGVIPILVIYLPNYSIGLHITPILIGAFIIFQMGDYFSIGLSLKNKTKYRALAGMTAAALNVALNFVFVARYGAWGAAASSIVSLSVFSLITLTKSYKVFPVLYNFRMLLFFSSIIILFSISVQLGFLLNSLFLITVCAFVFVIYKNHDFSSTMYRIFYRRGFEER